MSRAKGVRFLLLAVLLGLVHCTTYSSTDVCEKIDGDCPDDCHAAGFDGEENFNARFSISPSVVHLGTEHKAHEAEAYISSQGVVKNLDNPWSGLHTTMYYFCCYTSTEKKQILEGLRDMEWDPVTYHLDSFACNLDHDGETVYLHALPSNQTALFDFANTIEATVLSLGINIPKRETLYHMTLARVGYEYPTDAVVNYFLNDPKEWDFGKVTMNEFTIGSEKFKAIKENELHQIAKRREENEDDHDQ